MDRSDRTGIAINKYIIGKTVNLAIIIPIIQRIAGITSV